MATVEGQQVQRRFDAGWWFKQGVIGGLIAGIVFAVFEMVVAALLNGVNAFFMPLRMIGGIVLGSQALQPAYPLVSAAVTGIVVHMIFSMVFGVIFAVIVAYIPQLASTPAWLLVSASVFGLLLWLVNFYLIAPAAGWVWFPTNANPVVQFFAHTFFYGTVLGLYLNQVEDRQPEG